MKKMKMGISFLYGTRPSTKANGANFDLLASNSVFLFFLQRKISLLNVIH
jgi:hypothetical protein